jgi:hypothetical protein
MNLFLHDYLDFLSLAIKENYIVLLIKKTLWGERFYSNEVGKKDKSFFKIIFIILVLLV